MVEAAPRLGGEAGKLQTREGEKIRGDNWGATAVSSADPPPPDLVTVDFGGEDLGMKR